LSGLVRGHADGPLRAPGCASSRVGQLPHAGGGGGDVLIDSPEDLAKWEAGERAAAGRKATGGRRARREEVALFQDLGAGLDERPKHHKTAGNRPTGARPTTGPTGQPRDAFWRKTSSPRDHKMISHHSRWSPPPWSSSSSASSWMMMMRWQCHIRASRCRLIGKLLGRDRGPDGAGYGGPSSTKPARGMGTAPSWCLGVVTMAGGGGLSQNLVVDA